jgi:hypothetical protein
LKHHVVGDAIRPGIEEIGDLDVLAILEVDHQILATAADRCDLIRGHRHLNDRGFIEGQVAPAVGSKLRSSFVGDNDVFHLASPFFCFCRQAPRNNHTRF